MAAMAHSALTDEPMSRDLLDGLAPRHEGRNTRIFRFLAAAGMVIGQVSQNVALPVLSDTIGAAGGSPYFVVWLACLSFVVLFGGAIVIRFAMPGGLCSRDALMLSSDAQRDVWKIGFYNALNGMMVVFASPSSRTAPFLQAILGNFMIPITVLVRVWFLKAYPSKWEIVAAMIVVCGVFLSVGPTMVNGQDEAGNSVFWPMWFMCGFIPAAFMNVTEESALSKNQNARMGVFVFWLNFWQFVFVSFFFWVDVIPGYGMSSNLGEWAHHMQNGMSCFLFGETCGGKAFLWGMIFILAYMLSYVSTGFLLKFTSSATWQAVVSLVGPLGILWWAGFDATPQFHWGPSWGKDKTFPVLGLAVMLPGIVFFKLAGKLAKI